MRKIFSFPFSIFSLLVFSLLASCDNPLFISATGLYEVSFSVNGGSSIDSYRTNEIKEMPYTSRADYTFAGWHKKSDFSDATVTFPLEIKEDTTLYAKWQQEFTVSFETNGGDEIESYKTGIIPTSPDTSRTNYLFAGWYTNSDFSGEAVNFPYTVTKPTTLYAKWLRTYQVTFETNGGSAIASLQTGYIESSPATTKTDASLEGWYTDSECTTASKVSFPYTVTGDITLYAKWQAVQCTITVTGDVSLYAQWGVDYAALVTVNGGSFYFGDPNSSSERPKITLSSFLKPLCTLPRLGLETIGFCPAK